MENSCLNNGKKWTILNAVLCDHKFISVTVIPTWKRPIIKSEQVWNKCCMLVDKMEYKAKQHLHAASDLDAGQAIYEPTNRE